MVNIAGWMVVAGVVSWLAAWLIRGRVLQNRIHALQADARVKFEQLKRDMETRLGRVENDLLGAKEVIQLRDHAVAERDKMIRQQTEQLTIGLSQTATTAAERDSLQDKLSRKEASLREAEQALGQTQANAAEQEKRLAESEAQRARLAPLPAKLAASEANLQSTTARLESAQTLLKTQDEENSRLHKRTVELEPLTVQVKDRQARLAELESRLAEAVRVRDAEIAQLKKKVLELEALPQRYEALEASRAQLANEINVLRRAKDEEIESLQLELRAIPILERKLNERERQILSVRDEATVLSRDRELDIAAKKTALAQCNDELDQKDAVIGRLYQQLAELAPLPEALANHSARALELERGVALRENELRHANRAADDLRANLLEWMRLGGALPARDAEIARLRNRLREIE